MSNVGIPNQAARHSASQITAEPHSIPERKRRLVRSTLTQLLWLVLFLAAIASRAETPPVIKEDYIPSGTKAKFGVTSVQLWSKKGVIQTGGVQAKFGDTVRLGILDLPAWLEALKEDKTITSDKKAGELLDEQVSMIRLFIGHHLMRTIPVLEYFKDEPTWWWDDSWLETVDQKDPTVTKWIAETKAQAEIAKNRWWLVFVLRRDSADSESRQDWQEALTMPGRAPRMPLSVGFANPRSGTIHVITSWVQPGEKDDDTSFQMVTIGWDAWTISGIVVLAVTLISFFYLAFRSGIIREPTQPAREDGLPPFSLGRCQMAFWFFLSASAFYFLWLVTGRGDVNTINSTVLTLIGISAGTALGAAVISSNQADPVAAALPPPIDYPSQIEAAKNLLSAAKAARSHIDPANQAAIALADADIVVKSTQLADLQRRLKLWRKGNFRRFLNDILSDNDGATARRIITFHRFQIVVWSIVMGIVFVSEVLTKHAMPVFDPTLLTLMGISSGTYLGFKLPGTRPTT